ncbi:hypothetical protein D3C75_708910 [compost metagenome]
MVDDYCIRYKRIENTVTAQGAAGLAHPIANDFTAAKFAFITIYCIILFNFHPQLCVGETNSVSDGRTKHARIAFTVDLVHESLLSMPEDGL